MRLLYLILIAITGLSACTKNDINNYVNNNIDTMKTMPGTDSLNYLALGDSYTIGESVPASQSFPYQLVTGLKVKKYGFNPPEIIATTGWTTDNLIDAIESSSIKAKKYDIVTLLIGVNDQYQGKSRDNYKTKFQQLLNTAISFANGNKNHVFVLSIPDYGVTPFANGDDSKIGPEIDRFNAINQQESLSAGVNYLDITAISRQAATNATLIAGDGLHPSGVMYSLWMDQLVPMVVKNIK